jgi:hypothetical protein
MLHALTGAQPARLPGKSTDGVRAPRPRHKFAPGNKFGGRRRPVDTLAELDRVLRDTVARLARRSYEFETDATGQRVRVERPLDAARGNALANIVRARIELFEMREAVSEVRRLQAELEKLKAVTVSIMERSAR